MNVKFIFSPLILALAAQLTAADPTCDSLTWKLKGRIEKDALAYDKFLESIPPDGTDKINDYIRSHGLLIQLYSNTGEVRGHSNYLQSEDTSGANVGLFLKFMRATRSSNVVFDHIFEVEKPDSKKPIHKWNIPYGSQAPVGVRAYNVIYPETLRGICQDFKRQVYLSVSEEGNYKAIDREEFPAIKPIPEAECPAQHTFFHDSKTAACGKFKDLTSGKTKILIWDASTE